MTLIHRCMGLPGGGAKHTHSHTHAVEHTHPHAHTRGNPGSPHFHTFLLFSSYDDPETAVPVPELTRRDTHPQVVLECSSVEALAFPGFAAWSRQVFSCGRSEGASRLVFELAVFG